MLRTIPQTAVKFCAAALDRARRPPPGVVVLLYHRIGGETGLSVDVPTSRFDDQMSMLATQDRAADLDTALNALAGPARTSDPVVVTFDDGTADFVEAALPVLVKHRVPAVMYLATEFVDSNRAFPYGGRPLSWSGVRDAVSTGLVTIGSHTHTHALLDRLPPDDVERELERSSGLISDQLGIAAEHFAYPKARPGSPAAEAAVRRRFRSAALGGTRPNPYGRTDPFRLARTPVQRGDGPRFFGHKMNGGMRLEGALRDVYDRARYARASS